MPLTCGYARVLLEIAAPGAVPEAPAHAEPRRFCPAMTGSRGGLVVLLADGGVVLGVCSETGLRPSPVELIGAFDGQRGHGVAVVLGAVELGASLVGEDAVYQVGEIFGASFPGRCRHGEVR